MVERRRQGETIEQLIGLIGEDAFDLLSAAFPGQTIRINSGTSGQHYQRLVEVVGMENARRMAHEFSGTAIYIPNRAVQKSRRRIAAIVAEFDELTRHLSGTEAVRRIAAKYGVSDRWVYMVLKRT